MSARTKARKRALDILFEADQRGANVLDVLEERVALPGRESALPEYASQIVTGVVAHWTRIQEILQSVSTEWTVERMPAVDRALLRIGVWEILFHDAVPTAVAIDEAVELATSLSTPESPSFINGVLGAVARDAPAWRSHD